MKHAASMLLLLVAVAIVSAQDKLTIAVPSILPPPPPPPPPPPVCLADATLRTETAADTEDAEGDDPAGGPESLTYLPPQRRCEDGPVRKLLGGPNVFYWPPIYRGSCDNLFCKDPPCIARRKVWRYRCVLVYRFIRGCWRKIGYRTISYQDHLSCGCKQCSDIKDKKWCTMTKPCPNTNNKYSFCYWVPGIVPRPIGKRQATAVSLPRPIPLPHPIPIPRCACCTPFPCPPPKIFSKSSCSCVCSVLRCPPGQKLNPWTCKCECPRGTTQEGSKCFGDCSKIPTNQCPNIFCEDNKHFKCEVKNHKCECPSCDKANDALWCRKSVCLEQSTHPMCIWDPHGPQKNRCRCPECDDFHNDKKWCLKTKCGSYNHLSCKYEGHPWNKCFCPH